MSENVISESVIKERIDGLTNLVNRQFETNAIEHQTIIDQVTKTNGTVKKLEIAGAYMKGAIAVIVILVIPILLFIAKDYLVK